MHTKTSEKMSTVMAHALTTATRRQAKALLSAFTADHNKET
jgi:hypothetical protein